MDKIHSIFSKSELKNIVNNHYYRRDIDGLRAISIILVICFHAFPKYVTGGFVGVDVFFVISGYLISANIIASLDKGTFSLVNFYGRRIRRIAPALILVLLSAIIVGWILLSPKDYILLAKQVFGGATFSANFVLWMQSGYFQEAADAKPLLHLWSLGIEEQYYFLFPIILIILYRYSMVYVFILLIILSFILNLYLTNTNQEAAFYFPDARAWELLSGVLLALWQRKNSNPRWGSMASTIGIILILASAFLLDRHSPFPGWRALGPVIGAVLIIGADERTLFNSGILGSRLMVFIGLISYPLYLWHWPILSFMRISRMMDDPPAYVKVGAILGAVVLAYLTYIFIERPIRNLRVPQLRNRVSYGLLGGLCVSALLGVVVIYLNGIPTRYPGNLGAIASFDYKNAASLGMREGICFLYPQQTYKDFSLSCDDAMPIDTVNRRLIFIWGDSYAADLYPGINSFIDKSRFRIAQYTSSACAPILNLYVQDRPNCKKTNDFIATRIQKDHPDILIIGANWNFSRMNNQSINDLRKTLSFIKGQHIHRVILLGQPPIWHDNVVKILLKQGVLNSDHKIPLILSSKFYSKYDDDFLHSLALDFSYKWVSPFDVLCSASGCLVATGVNPEDIVTWDTGHFTPHGSWLFVRRAFGSLLE